MKPFRLGGWWLFILLPALLGVNPVYAQASNDSGFLSMLGELREASYPDKENIVERLGQDGAKPRLGLGRPEPEQPAARIPSWMTTDPTWMTRPRVSKPTVGTPPG